MSTQFTIVDQESKHVKVTSSEPFIPDDPLPLSAFLLKTRGGHLAFGDISFAFRKV